MCENQESCSGLLLILSYFLHYPFVIEPKGGIEGNRLLLWKHKCSIVVSFPVLRYFVHVANELPEMAFPHPGPSFLFTQTRTIATLLGVDHLLTTGHYNAESSLPVNLLTPKQINISLTIAWISSIVKIRMFHQSRSVMQQILSKHNINRRALDYFPSVVEANSTGEELDIPGGYLGFGFW